MKTKLLTWLKRIAIAYVVIGLLLYFFQEQLLLRPTALPNNYSYQFKDAFIDTNIRYNENTTFNLIQFLPKDISAKKVVLYFHGNRENINHYEVYATNFTKNGYEVWMCDYPTFGKSTGKLTEEILYQEALQVYQLASKKFKEENIVIYGKSFGTGIAAQLASTQTCKRLILETPYYNITSLAKRYAWVYPVQYFVKYKIPTNEYLQKVTAPISIFHGDNDWVIPYSNCSKLKTVIKPTDEFITIEKGSHNTLNDFSLFHHKLDSLLAH